MDDENEGRGLSDSLMYAIPHPPPCRDGSDRLTGLPSDLLENIVKLLPGGRDVEALTLTCTSMARLGNDRSLRMVWLRMHCTPSHALHIAIRHFCDFEAVECILRLHPECASSIYRSTTGLSHMHHACRYGNEKAVRVILRARQAFPELLRDVVNVPFLSSVRMTALHISAHIGHARIVSVQTCLEHVDEYKIMPDPVRSKHFWWKCCVSSDHQSSCMLHALINSFAHVLAGETVDGRSWCGPE